MTRMHALIWELWVRNRLLIVGITAVFLCSLILYPLLGHWFPQWRSLRDIGYLPPFGSILVVAIICGYGEFEGFPERNYLLPVKTLQLVIAPILLGMIVIPLTYFAWVLVIMRPNGYELSLLWPALGLICCNLWFQTLSWSFAGKQIQGVLALSLSIPGTIILTAMASGVELGQPEWFSAWVSRLCLLLFAGLAMYLSYRNVSRKRIGDHLSASTGFSIKYYLAPPVLNPFSSPQKAQFWYEWRMFGYTLPGLLIVVIGVMCIIPLIKELSFDKTFILTFSLIAMFLLTMIAGASEFAKSAFAANEHGMNLFWATRPLSNQKIAHAKLKLLFGSFLLSWIVLCLGVYSFMAIAGQLDQLVTIYDRLIARFGDSLVQMWVIVVPILLFFGAWVTGAMSMTVSLVGSKKFIGSLMSGVSTIAGLCFLYIISTYQKPEDLVVFLPKIPYVLLTLSTILCVGIIFVCKLAVKANTLDPRTLVKVGVPSCMVLGSCALWLGLSSIVGAQKLGWVMFCISLWLGVLLVQIAAPLAVSYARHK